MTVRYQVAHASWAPLYDARLATGAKTAAPKLDLTRRAAITQHTGEAWDEVDAITFDDAADRGRVGTGLDPMTVDFEPEYKPRPVAARRQQAAAGVGRSGRRAMADAAQHPSLERERGCAA